MAKGIDIAFDVFGYALGGIAIYEGYLLFTNTPPIFIKPDPINAFLKDMLAKIQAQLNQPAAPAATPQQQAANVPVTDSNEVPSGSGATPSTNIGGTIAPQSPSASIPGPGTIIPPPTAVPPPSTTVPDTGGASPTSPSGGGGTVTSPGPIPIPNPIPVSSPPASIPGPVYGGGSTPIPVQPGTTTGTTVPTSSTGGPSSIPVPTPTPIPVFTPGPVITPSPSPSPVDTLPPPASLPPPVSQPPPAAVGSGGGGGGTACPSGFGPITKPEGTICMPHTVGSNVSVNVAPNPVGTGQSMTVSGGGFGNKETLDINFVQNGITKATTTVKTDGHGKFSKSITANTTSNGLSYVQATGRSTHRSKAHTLVVGVASAYGLSYGYATTTRNTGYMNPFFALRLAQARQNLQYRKPVRRY